MIKEWRQLKECEAGRLLLFPSYPESTSPLGRLGANLDLLRTKVVMANKTLRIHAKKLAVLSHKIQTLLCSLTKKSNRNNTEG